MGLPRDNICANWMEGIVHRIFIFVVFAIAITGGIYLIFS